MIDPIGPNPRVFSGSANFSWASVTGNDENMLLLSGEWAAEVAPVMVNEFILLLCAPEAKKAETAAAIDELVNRAILIRQPRLGG